MPAVKKDSKRGKSPDREAGRPRKYSKKTLKEAVDRYFKSISTEAPLKDERGRTIKDRNGQAVRMIKYFTPPSVTGLCLALGIDRSTWQNYAADGAETAEVCAEARAVIELYLEEQLVTKEKSVQGIIFNLQNNYGWKQRQTIDINHSAGKGEESLSMAEKKKFIDDMLTKISDGEGNEKERRGS